MDSFFGIGLFELVMIAVIALLVLGPERLPGAMREVAKYMRQLRNISSEFQSQFSEELKVLDEINPRRILNEAIDPNNPAASPANSPTKTAAAKPAAAPAKPAATVAAAAKPLAPKPVAPPAPAGTASTKPAAAPLVANGEPANTILPPAKSASTAEPLTDAADAADSPPQLAADALPPAGDVPPAPVDLPPSALPGHNGTGPAAPADQGPEASQ